MHDFTGFTTKSIKETKEEIVDMTKKKVNKQNTDADECF